MGKKTRDGLEAMERYIKFAGGFFEALSLEIAEFMLDPVQGGHEPGLIIRR